MNELIESDRRQTETEQRQNLINSSGVELVRKLAWFPYIAGAEMLFLRELLEEGVSYFILPFDEGVEIWEVNE